MTYFKNAIITKSTFSWWGAYLGDMNIVICPKKQFSDKIDESQLDNIYPSHWIKL